MTNDNLFCEYCGFEIPEDAWTEGNDRCNECAEPDPYDYDPDLDYCDDREYLEPPCGQDYWQNDAGEWRLG